jgi:hypothetical protein
MNVAEEQVAMALISLRDAQYHIKQTTKYHTSPSLDLMSFEIEKMAKDLVTIAKTVQNR